MSNLIDRQVAIDSLTLNAGWKDEEGRSVEDWDERKKIWTALINLIPSAQPERKRGRWINVYDSGVAFKRCSECGIYVEDIFFANDYEVNFCPNCGADMRGKQDVGRMEQKP